MIVWASDTQEMITHERMRPAFRAMCDWIVNEAETKNIAAFLHTGDMVDNGDVAGQWNLFNEGIAEIEEKVPFFWAAGNHDAGFSGNAPWKQQPYVKALPKEQKYNNGDAAYMILNAGSTQLLFLSVAYYREKNEDAISWLKKVCKAHPDIPAVLITHGYLTDDGKLMNIARLLESNLVASCPNIRLILSGHARGISRAKFTYDDDGDGKADRTVNALMYDIQTDMSRYGYVCLLTYDPVSNTLFVDSYSPFRDDYIYNDRNPDKERFKLNGVF